MLKRSERRRPRSLREEGIKCQVRTTSGISYGNRHDADSGGARLTLQWKMSLFRHLLRLALSFFERRPVGDLASRLSVLHTFMPLRCGA